MEPTTQQLQNRIDASGLSATQLGQTSISIPPTKTLPNAENLGNYLAPETGAVNNAVSQAEAQKAGNVDNLKSLFSQISGKASDQQAMEQASGLPDLTKQLNEASNQFRITAAEQNQLIQEAGMIPLQQQQDILNRGITTTGGLAPLQASKLRENAIKQYTVTSKGLFQQALIANLKGDIATAQDAVQKSIDYKYKPLEDELAFTKDVLINLDNQNLERADKKQLQVAQQNLDERKRLLDNQKEEDKAIQKIALDLSSFGVDNATIQQVANAKTVDEAIALAGSKLQDPEAKLRLESLRLDHILTKSQINKSNYELQLLKEYGGLTPTQYADKLKEEKKAIDEAKDDQEKARLQGIALNKQVTLLDSVLNSNAIDSVVGPNVFSRASGTVKGEIGRFVLGGLPALQGVKDYFTGSTDRLIGQTEQFISAEFLKNLIDVKAQGATFGALQKSEQDALTAAATYIGQRRVYSGKGEDKQVTGYDMSETDFKKELKTIQDLTRKAYERATGKSFDESEQAELDKMFNSQPVPSQYY